MEGVSGQCGWGTVQVEEGGRGEKASAQDKRKQMKNAKANETMF
jgi:hypothetical protein